MLDFEKLEVYQKAKEFYVRIEKDLLSRNDIDLIIRDQLRLSSLNIALLIVEACSKIDLADQRNYFVEARGATYKCVAVFDLLKMEAKVPQENWDSLYIIAEEISIMLYALFSDQN